MFREESRPLRSDLIITRTIYIIVNIGPGNVITALLFQHDCIFLHVFSFQC
ncbi:hypothetical protein CC2G_008410 [Coprinopsis cinerea AmutBmut pab1-1]|nr:hypothetical protein CC2G_008410 [Coprinopsis cinerea AmutBmut pab1-1]